MGRGFLSEGMETFDLAQSQCHFSFQTGAIKSGVFVGGTGPNEKVSIPNWCD